MKTQDIAPHNFELHQFKDPQLPFIFHTDTPPQAEHMWAANWHDSPEFLYVLEGDGVLFCAGERYDVTAGQLLVIGSGEMHHLISGGHLRYHCLIIGSAFCVDNGFDPAKLHYPHILTDRTLIDAYLTIITELQDTSATFRVTAIRCAMLSFLLRLNRTYAALRADIVVPGTTDPVRDGLQYIGSHYRQPITLDDIAAHARISKYHFLRRFKQATGYTIGTYIRLLRCRRATKLLRTTDDRIGDIARACGFESPSYFAKAFTETVGMRPADYRAAAALTDGEQKASKTCT